MSRLVYADGSMIPRQDAKVSVFDHGLLYGDGVFEGIRAYNGRVFKLAEHIRRLYESAHSILLRIPLDQKEMEEAVLQTVRANGFRDCYIRLVVTRGVGDLGLDPSKCGEPSVFIVADDIILYPEEAYRKGLPVMSVAVRRTAPDALSPRVKSLNYLNNVMAKAIANLAGVPEVLMLNQQGYVVEGTGDNVFIVRGRTLITPAPYLGILEGVTRNTVMEMASSMGFEVSEGVFSLHDVYVADECFLTGTAAEIAPVTVVDGRAIGTGEPGPVTRRLMEGFRDLANSTGTPL
ncbi:MAG: branched-chain-amino-acid transaminase [Firmicutes bacterium]|jgi:branched-chain amino acid aminotransferase|nr:branched-chain-amino-acid transaminase [Bacillota bacterium]